MALQIVWMVVTYHRPGEPLTARRRDVIRPTRGGSAEWGVVLFPETRDQVRKTGHRNEAITLKNEIFPWLPRLLEQVALGDPESRLFDHSYSEILQQFRITTYRMGLPKLVMYQARHSGASLDRQGRFRDILDVKNLHDVVLPGPAGQRDGRGSAVTARAMRVHREYELADCFISNFIPPSPIRTSPPMSIVACVASPRKLSTI